MIPKRLTLINFLSYREVTLDFAGLHVACICGPNGAGKSSLLEAMVWSVWGHSRVATDDDVIHLGAKEARVEFIFENQSQVYRIVRGRRRRQGCLLEFQIQTSNGFRSITQKGVRATQQLILEHLKVDYETFIHSAYLRQGRADEFMLKRPGERKQILADLLKLNQYDRLAEKARDRGRNYQAEINVLSTALAQAEIELAERSAIATHYQNLQQQANQTQAAQQANQSQRSQLQQQRQQRQQQQQSLQTQRQQLDYWHQSQTQRQLELEKIEQRYRALQSELAAVSEIEAGYLELQRLQGLAEDYAQRFEQYQQIHAKKIQLRAHYQTQQGALQTALGQAQLKLDTLNDTIAELQHSLSQRENIETNLKQLQTARQQLSALDQRQVDVAPLQQRRQQVHTRLKQASARLEARLEGFLPLLFSLNDRSQKPQDLHPYNR
ncbi:MAG: SMC family ATPase [Leptolyngbyaceae cyanobacterium MAG.088]|nr:SMC family ATPase [Leptolyngbyaceae cyanobacterium MAG.088]